jgi:hypothetical protein
MIQFQVQDVYNWENHNSGGYGNNVIIQPVVPIPMPWEAVPMLITRTTIPYVSTPDLGPGVNRKHGFGDTSLLGLFTPKLQWGLFAFQTWSFADDQQDREDVSALSLQPFITLHLNKCWYIGSPDNPQTYNSKNDKWTWALGGQVGRVRNLGKLPVKLFFEVLNNPEDNAGATAEWTAKFNMTMLFPE